VQIVIESTTTNPKLLQRMSKKRRAEDVAQELKFRREEADKLEKKQKLAVVCNHIKLHYLFPEIGKVKSFKLKDNPPQGMSGYVFTCPGCEGYLGVMNQEIAKKGFSTMYEYQLEQALMQIQKSGIIIA